MYIQVQGRHQLRKSGFKLQIQTQRSKSKIPLQHSHLKSRKDDYNSLEHSASQGDAQTQKSLVDLLSLQIDKQKAAQDISTYVDSQKDELTEIVDKAKEEFDKLGLSRDADQNKNFAEIQKQMESTYQEFLVQFEQQRQDIKEVKKEFNLFKEKIIKSQNKHLFFQSLYQDPDSKKEKAQEAASQEGRRKNGGHSQQHHDSKYLDIETFVKKGNGPQQSLDIYGRGMYNEPYVAPKTLSQEQEQKIKQVANKQFEVAFLLINAVPALLLLGIAYSESQQGSPNFQRIGAVSFLFFALVFGSVRNVRRLTQITTKRFNLN